ncbi:MAG: type II toxin-antitoxin system VapC family toxin [Opitutaceae bacterium]|nr:type II toxin-antitoxin system VapC family toxin [Opitutaceae bacterium]
MRLLLDSHVVVWWSVFPGRLNAAAREAIRSPDNEVFLSAATVWELGLKITRGKLRLPPDYAARLLAHGCEELPVTIAHTTLSVSLPALHGDPFDRLLIAQALADGLMLVTSDREIMRYDVPVLEA